MVRRARCFPWALNATSATPLTQQTTRRLFSSIQRCCPSRRAREHSRRPISKRAPLRRRNKISTQPRSQDYAPVFPPQGFAASFDSAASSNIATVPNLPRFEQVPLVSPHHILRAGLAQNCFG